MKYNRLVLNIPHSSDNVLYDGWNSRNALKKHIKRWTDWKTDELFVPDKLWENDSIRPVIAHLSRFTLDIERLEDDPLESIGQGIIYTKFEDCYRNVDDALRAKLRTEYLCYMAALKTALQPGALLIDCHSFPSNLSDTDVCIGTNNDWSKPDEETINAIKRLFENYGYKVSINEPYANSITPDAEFEYNSIMIELNKRTYMNEETMTFQMEGMKHAIMELYSLLLDS